MSTEIATQNPSRELVATLRTEQFQNEIAMALPPDVTPQRFVRAAITALQASPDIIRCDRSSILRSLIQSAQMGLMPDGREAALVAFGSNATLIPMVGGYRKIAGEHGWTIRSAVVYENDDFDYELGLNLRLVHRPAGLRENRGEVVGAYAIAAHKDGRRELEVMSREEIEKVRAVSRSKDRGPWKDWFERMVEKTPVRRLFPKLPLDKTDDRLTQILAATDLELDPNAATRLLYGPEQPKLEAAQDPPDAAAGDGMERQQAGEDGGAAAASSPVPGEDDEPEPPVGQQSAFPIPDKAIEEAGSFVIPEKRNSKGELSAASGQSLAELAATADGHAWLAWAIRRAPSYWTVSFREALDLFVEHRAPEVWAAYVAEREAA